MTSIPPPAPKNDYSDLVNLFDVYTTAENDIRALEAELNASHLGNVRLHIDRYKTLATTLGETKAAIEVIAARNPQWFAERQTLESPFGEVKRTSSTSLVIADEAVTIALIEHAGRGADFLRKETRVNREALEALSDEQLAKYGVARKTEHNYKVAAAKVDLGKAVKAAEKSDKAASKTAKKAAAAAAGALLLGLFLWLLAPRAQAAIVPAGPVFSATLHELAVEAQENRETAELLLRWGIPEGYIHYMARAGMLDELALRGGPRRVP